MDKFSKLVDILTKAGGEGSRGGNVIGHTRTGKPIYDSSQHHTHVAFSSKEHLDAMNHHHEVWTKTQAKIAAIRQQRPGWNPPKAIHDFLKHHYTQMQMHQSRSGQKERREVEQTKNLKRSLEKAEKHEERPPFYAAMVVLSNDGKSILLGKRREDGIWTGPGGGAKMGEMPKQAAIREGFEEANLKLDERQFEELPMGYAHDQRPVHCYLVRLSPEQEKNISVVNDPDKEVPSWKWFPLDAKLPEPISENRYATITNAKMHLAGIVMKSYFLLDQGEGASQTSTEANVLENMEQHPMRGSIMRMMDGYQPGDEPRRLLLNAEHILHLVKLDEGMYSGFVKKTDQNGMEIETVITVEKMTAPAIVQLLQAKEIIPDAVTERGQRYAAGMDHFAEQIAEQERRASEKAALMSLFPEPQTMDQERALIRLVERLYSSDLKKAKALPVGTVRQWGPYKYVKHNDGWVVMGGDHHGKLMGDFKSEPKYGDYARHHQNTSVAKPEPKESPKPKAEDAGQETKPEPKAEGPASDAPKKSDEEMAREQIAQAGELGKKAHAEGRKAVPAQDAELMKLLQNRKGGSSLPLLDAWSKAWHKANLDANPIPEPEPKREEPKAPTKPVELKPAQEAPKGSAIPPEPKEEPAKAEEEELTPEQKQYRQDRPSVVARVEQLKPHTMGLKEYIEHRKELRKQDILQQNLRPGPNGEPISDERKKEVEASVERYMERNKRKMTKDYTDEHRVYTEAAVNAGYKVSEEALKEYPGLGGSDLPEGIDMELNKKTNMIKMVDLGKSSKAIKAKFASHLNECNKLVDAMGIKFKTPLKFKATNLGKLGKTTRGTYQPGTKTIELKDMTNGGKVLMHEIGHALDYAMQEKGTGRGRHMEMTGGRDNNPHDELQQLYRQLDDVVTQSDYYTKQEDRKHKQYLATPTEVFARAFEVYSLAKAEELGLEKEFVETFIPDVFKTKDEKIVEMQKQIAELRKQYREVRGEKPFTELDEETSKKLEELLNKQNELQTQYMKRSQETGTGWITVAPEKQAEYKTKVSEIMSKILAQDQIRKAAQEIDLVRTLQKANGQGGLPVGSVRLWGGQKFIKQGDGHWVPLPSGQQGQAQQQGSAAVAAKPVQAPQQAQPEQQKPDLKVVPKEEPKSEMHPTEHLKPQKGFGGHMQIHSEDLKAALKHGPISIISAGRNPNNSEDRAMTDEQINERYKRLEQDLKDAGYKYTKVVGHYGGKEDSFIVHHADQKEMNALGKKYNQDSVIHSEKGKNRLHFTTGEHEGKHHKGEGYEEVPDAQDYFSEVSTTDGTKSKFSLGLDFGQHHEDDSENKAS